MDKIKDAAAKLFPIIDNGSPDDWVNASKRSVWVDGATSEAAREYWEGQGWVRVEDGLPERSFSGETVLCFNGNYIHTGYMKFDVWYNHKYEPVDVENGWAVTHWRKLPAPPNQ